MLWQLLGTSNAYLVVVLTADRVNLDPESRPFDELFRLDSFLRIVQWPGAALRAFVVPCRVERDC